MACVELKHLVDILQAITNTSPDLKDRVTALSARASSIGDAICGSLEAVAADASTKGLPYEVDGGKGAYYMDDANIPSLLSLPILGYMAPSNNVYSATRQFVLSDANPFWFSGDAYLTFIVHRLSAALWISGTDGAGIGGPHAGMYYAWPMGIIVRAMTSTSDEEISQCLELLVRTSAGTGFMHESFNVDNVNNYTRCCVCVCVCVCACACVYACVCMYVRMCVFVLCTWC